MLEKIKRKFCHNRLADTHHRMTVVIRDRRAKVSIVINSDEFNATIDQDGYSLYIPNPLSKFMKEFEDEAKKDARR